jgi:hypothetical protein
MFAFAQGRRRQHFGRSDRALPGARMPPDLDHSLHDSFHKNCYLSSLTVIQKSGQTSSHWRQAVQSAGL